MSDAHHLDHEARLCAALHHHAAHIHPQPAPVLVPDTAHSLRLRIVAAAIALLLIAGGLWLATRQPTATPTDTIPTRLLEA